LESQKEVAELIQRVQPNKVVLELCSSRTSILKLDEQVLLKEAKEMDTNRIIEIIKQVNVLNQEKARLKFN
jgi:pheromone shutdown protein TraB